MKSFVKYVKENIDPELWKDAQNQVVRDDPEHFKGKWSKNLPRNVVETLATHPEPEARYWVAIDNTTPRDILTRISKEDPVPGIRLAAKDSLKGRGYGLENGIAAADVRVSSKVWSLIKDDDPRLNESEEGWKQAKMNLIHSLTYNQIKKNFELNDYCKNMAPGIEEAFASHPDARIRWRVASDLSAKKENLKQLMSDPEPTVAQAAKDNLERDVGFNPNGNIHHEVTQVDNYDKEHRERYGIKPHREDGWQSYWDYEPGIWKGNLGEM